MNPRILPILLLALISSASADIPPPRPPAPVEPAPAETVQPATPAAPAEPLPANAPASFSQDQVRQIETALKKQMMLVGMGSGVVGLLLGMMIGRKTAPRVTTRRF